MNYPFKQRYTATPQHDSEGFPAEAGLGMDAQCRGCTPDELCPRSGHCERYESPIRATHGIPAWMVSDLNDKLAVAKSAFAEHTAEMAEAKALVEHADRAMSDTEINIWQRQVLEDAADAALAHMGVHAKRWDCTRSCLHQNPKGWQEVDGVTLPPITWGEPK